MTPVQETKRFTIYFYGSIVVVVWFVVVASNTALALPDPLVAIRGLSIGGLVAYLFSMAMDRWLWRLRLLQTLFGILDISGRWEGWYWSALGRKWLPNAHEIVQHSWRVSFRSWGPNNQSSTDYATLLSDGRGNAELAAIYTTKVISGNTEEHTGASSLSLSSANGESRLNGTYWTNRRRDDGTRGQYGYIRLVRVSDGKRNRTGWSYEKNSWAMPEPTDSPEPERQY